MNTPTDTQNSSWWIRWRWACQVPPQQSTPNRVTSTSSMLHSWCEVLFLLYLFHAKHVLFSGVQIIHFYLPENFILVSAVMCVDSQTMLTADYCLDSLKSLISNSVEIFLNLKVSDSSFDLTSVFTLSLTVRITPTKNLRFKQEKPPSQCWLTKFWSHAPEDTPVSVFSSLSLFSYVIWISQHCSNWC